MVDLITNTGLPVIILMLLLGLLVWNELSQFVMPMKGGGA